MTGTEPELDDVAARALAAIVLEHTADMVNRMGDNAAEVIVKLEGDTGLSLDVCAAILMATSWLAGAGELTGEAVYAGSLGIDPSDG